MWWTRIVAEYPIVLLASVLAINWTLIIISFTTESLPSFEDPLIGFEVRGTQISERTNAWKLLLDGTTSNGIINLQSKTNISLKTEAKQLSPTKEKELDALEELENKAFRSRNHNLKSNQFFCGKLYEDYAQFVIASIDNRDLLSVESVKTLCEIDRQLLRLSRFVSVSENCFQQNCEIKNSGECCQSWALHNYLLVLVDKNSCEQINDTDITVVKDLLTTCSPFYHNMTLNDDCLNEPSLCKDVPKKCYKRENSVFNLIHFLIDYHYLNPNKPNDVSVRYTNIFLPIAKSTKLLDYFKQLTEENLELNGLKVIAMDLGLKQIMFDQYLLHDTIYLIIAFFVILFSLYFYTTSLIVTIITVLTIITSLGTAYFCYTKLFGMTFFPFMNLLSIVIAIGIGSDNALIYCKIWELTKSDKSEESFLQMVGQTLNHAWVSVFAASVTTGLALFAGYFSSITCLQCFSVFASTSVAINFVITLLTLPSAVIIADRFSLRFQSFWKFHSLISRLTKVFFEEILFKLILKFRYLIVLLLGLMSILSAVVVVYKPKLQLPDSEEFQIFNSNHYFERYDFEFKNQFWFKRIRDEKSDVFSFMPIRVVFGVKSEDNGDHLNPWIRGSLQFEPEFDISSKESQLWLIQFCKQLRSQSFYHKTIGPLLSNCFIETFKDWMDNRICTDSFSHVNRTPCCMSSQFPYEPSVFNQCINEVIDLMDKTPNYDLTLDWAGPRYDKKSLQMMATVIEYDSNYRFSHSFIEMNSFWNEINGWISQKISSAPKGLQKGWFISSNLEFYALQLSLSEGTLKSIGFSVIFSFMALIFTTFDLKLSILSVLTISSTIFTTIATLVGLNWKLNVLESISISLAVGLAIDFALHYTIAFKLSPQNENKIHYSLSRIASPVAMAALTTCMSGILMLFSSIQAYVQIGTFLIVLSLISWLYSTVFHLSLLSIFESPVNQIGNQSTNPLLKCLVWRRQSSLRSDPTVRRSTLESITSGQKTNGSATNGGLSVSSSPTNSSFQFQTNNECHEMEKMIKT